MLEIGGHGKIVTISFLGHLVFFRVGFPFKLCCVFFFLKNPSKGDEKRHRHQGDHLGLRAEEGNPSIVPAQSGSENPKKTAKRVWDFG